MDSILDVVTLKSAIEQVVQLRNASEISRLSDLKFVRVFYEKLSFSLSTG